MPNNAVNNNLFACSGLPYNVGLTQSPILIANTAGTSVDTSFPIIIFTNVIADTASGYNAGTGRYTIPTTGRYLMTANLLFSTQTYGGNQIQLMKLYKNGSVLILLNATSWSSATVESQVAGSAIVNCTSGDIFDIRAYNGTTTSLTNTPQDQYFSIAWIGK